MHLAANIDLISGVSGGLLIGVSSTAFLILTGKLTGLSGLVEESILPVKKEDMSWMSHKSFSLSYIAGLILSGFAYHKYNPQFLVNDNSNTSSLVMIAGFLVGYGTRLGSGCTSGHGVCGLSRFSLRSAVATLTFMATGAVGAVIGRFLRTNGHETIIDVSKWDKFKGFGRFLPAVVVYSLAFSFFHGLQYFNHQQKQLTTQTKKNDDVKIVSSPPPTSLHIPEHIAAFTSAFVFGIGLSISGMCNFERVIGFLDFTGPNGWDPSLAGVMGGAVVFNILSFRMLHSLKTPVFLRSITGADRGTLNNVLKLDLHPDNVHITKQLVIGSSIFGLGWGLGGICPGPAIVQMGVSYSLAAVFIPSLIVGMSLEQMIHHQ